MEASPVGVNAILFSNLQPCLSSVHIVNPETIHLKEVQPSKVAGTELVEKVINVPFECSVAFDIKDKPDFIYSYFGSIPPNAVPYQRLCFELHEDHNHRLTLRSQFSYEFPGDKASAVDHGQEEWSHAWIISAPRDKNIYDSEAIYHLEKDEEKFAVFYCLLRMCAADSPEVPQIIKIVQTRFPKFSEIISEVDKIWTLSASK